MSCDVSCVSLSSKKYKKRKEKKIDEKTRKSK